MQKLIATLSNHPSPLERPLFDGEKTIEFEVIDPHNHEEVLNTLEPKVIELRGDDRTAIEVWIRTESGNNLMHGTIREGFQGTVMTSIG